jgi:hypothetical protein
MNLNTEERSVLAGLADVLIPAGDGFPAASMAGVTSEGLDRLLAVRPDLTPGLKKLLSAAKGREPAEVMAELKATDPAGFGILTELVPGAYFMNPDVRSALGYDGQVPHPIDPRPDHLEDGLLQSVIDRGPVYRSTPGNETKNRE